MLDFVVNNYIIILVVGVFLIFALIGFGVDTAKNRKNKESELLNQPNDEVVNDLASSEPKEEVVEEINNDVAENNTSETEPLNNMTDDGLNIPEAE